MEYREDDLAEMIEADRRGAIFGARRLLEADPLILDTETTGLDENAEICELAIITHEGKVVVDSLVKPIAPIPAEATAVHGITSKDVSDAPSLLKALRQVDAGRILKGRTVGIYNVNYDLRLLRQSIDSRRRNRHLQVIEDMYANSVCVMELYAHYYGKWHERYESYTWQSLEDTAIQCDLEWTGESHRALSDARMTLALLEHMAESMTGVE